MLLPPSDLNETGPDKLEGESAINPKEAGKEAGAAVPYVSFCDDCSSYAHATYTLGRPSQSRLPEAISKSSKARALKASHPISASQGQRECQQDNRAQDDHCRGLLFVNCSQSAVTSKAALELAALESSALISDSSPSIYKRIAEATIPQCGMCERSLVGNDHLVLARCFDSVDPGLISELSLSGASPLFLWLQAWERTGILCDLAEAMIVDHELFRSTFGRKYSLATKKGRLLNSDTDLHSIPEVSLRVAVDVERMRLNKTACSGLTQKSSDQKSSIQEHTCGVQQANSRVHTLGADASLIDWIKLWRHYNALPQMLLVLARLATTANASEYFSSLSPSDKTRALRLSVNVGSAFTGREYELSGYWARQPSFLSVDSAVRNGQQHSKPILLAHIGYAGVYRSSTNRVIEHQAKTSPLFRLDALSILVSKNLAQTLVSDELVHAAQLIQQPINQATSSERLVASPFFHSMGILIEQASGKTKATTTKGRGHDYGAKSSIHIPVLDVISGSAVLDAITGLHPLPVSRRMPGVFPFTWLVHLNSSLRERLVLDSLAQYRPVSDTALCRPASLASAHINRWLFMVRAQTDHCFALSARSIPQCGMAEPLGSAPAATDLSEPSLSAPCRQDRQDQRSQDHSAFSSLHLLGYEVHVQSALKYRQDNRYQDTKALPSFLLLSQTLEFTSVDYAADSAADDESAPVFSRYRLPFGSIIRGAFAISGASSRLVIKGFNRILSNVVDNYAITPDCATNLLRSLIFDSCVGLIGQMPYRYNLAFTEGGIELALVSYWEAVDTQAVATQCVHDFGFAIDGIEAYAHTLLSDTALTELSHALQIDAGATLRYRDLCIDALRTNTGQLLAIAELLDEPESEAAIERIVGHINRAFEYTSRMGDLDPSPA